MRIPLPLVLLALVLGRPGELSLPASPPAAPPLQATHLLETGGPIRIVCFGDSVTGVYYHTGSRRAWCDVLGLTLQRLYPTAQIEMINAGISGNTTAQGLARIQKDVIDRHPQLVVTMFGLNDIARGKGPAEYRDHLIQIIQRSRAAGAEVILMTTNSVYPEDPTRPPSRVAEYAEVVREVGHTLRVPVADCYRAYEAIHAIDARSWEHLMSETIHPNMRGHKLFAEEVAWTISGKRHWLDELPPLDPGFPRVLARWQQKQPIKVTAMPPYDQLIGTALQSLLPGAVVQVSVWKPDPKGLSQIVDQAKGIGWFKFYHHSGLEQPDLMVVAVPANALAPTPSEFYRSYTAVLNASLPIGPGGWDFLAILPSVAKPALDPAEKTAENLAREVLEGQDVPWLERSSGDSAPPEQLLSRRLKPLLGR